MDPFILRDDTIIVKPCDYTGINLGDIILFKLTKISKINIEGKSKNVRYVVHRVIGRRIIEGKKYLIQKGYAHMFGYPVKYEQVIGKVVVIERGDYSIELNKIKWKILNMIFTILAVSEYGLSEVSKYIFKFLPKKSKYYFMRKFSQIALRLKGRIYQSF